MLVNELRNKFIAIRNYEPIDVNDLLDFARQNYLRGELTILEYRNIIRVLENDGAKKPESSIDEFVGL